MTEVSLNFRAAAYAQESGVFPIALITMTHPSWSVPVRFSGDPTQRLIETASEIVYGTQSNGEDYYFFPGILKLPDDTDDGPRRMEFEFSNVNREYVQQIRAITGRIAVDVSLVMSNALDDLEGQWPEFNVVDISYDAGFVRLVMETETLNNEPYPYGIYGPNWFTGLFRGL